MNHEFGIGAGDSGLIPIVTITLNPAIDEAVSIDHFVLGSTNRCRLDSLDPGGKGVNVSRLIRRLGRATIALGFVGGVTGALLRARLDVEGVPNDFDDVPDLTRLNVMVYESALGRRTRAYLPGARVDPSKLDALRTRLAAIPPASTVVIGGSIPPGLAPTVYRDLVGELKDRGIAVIVDSSGPSLAAAIGAGPTLIKPNVEEAAEILGRPLVDDRDVTQAALDLMRRGAKNVVVSQGEEGAIGVGPEGCWKAVPPKIAAISTVGSGDSMVAGLAIAIADGRGLAEGLRLGTAAGAATAMTPGTQLGQADDVAALLPQVAVNAIPPPCMTAGLSTVAGETLGLPS